MTFPDQIRSLKLSYMITLTQSIMERYIIKNRKYPENALQERIEGRVILRFVVEKDGKISDTKVLRGEHPSLTNEAICVLNLMPDWVPGKDNGIVVAVYYTLPFMFKCWRK